MSEEIKKSQRALTEEKVLKFWKENKIFEKSLKKEAPRGEYVFYEGPPTANGKPGIHHLEARAFKDVIPRYKTMKGYHVRRKGGWDTHGLPVELQVEKKLGLSSKKAIEEYGIAKFNQQCKESVWEYTDLWEKFTERIGFWVDQDNPYVTYHNNYIESVWNVIKQADKQKLLYKDYKVVPWCPRCGTGLSSHELAQGYENVKDLSVYVKFKVVGQDNTYILAWTTTPWTLPGNVALAVGEKIDYVKIDKDGVMLILAKSRLSIIEGEFKIVQEFKGKDLIDLEYEPLYPYLSDTISDLEKQKLDKAFKVYNAGFVTTEDGTGVVHTAVMYGVDDFVLGNQIGLPKHHMVGLDGKFLEGTDFLEGRFVRDEEVAVDIIKDLAHRGLLLKKEKYEHSYPHCWRCKTALIYYARDSWYIRMTQLRDKMVKENQGINWEPSYIKEGRFGEWLRDIKDWAISRERYWGSPLPVWTCDKCLKNEVIGSIEEIKSKTKKSGNQYLLMRHGQAENNVIDVYHADAFPEADLTKIGYEQILKSAEELKNKKIDIVFSSPFDRTKETAETVCQKIGFPLDKIIYDDRLKEWDDDGFLANKNKGEVMEYYNKTFMYHVEDIMPGSESFAQVIKRIGDFFYEIENKYKYKNILIVGHNGAIKALSFVVEGLTFSNLPANAEKIISLNNAEVKKFDFTPLPHNENYELDLHKPYIDDVELVCDCGGKLTRTKEVMDVWLDSGTMPFSQDHYPFENKKLIDGPGYPADFISEAMDQTRGWFYTLHAVGAIMGKGKAYKNVICLGLLLDANGKKMSKSVGNVVDPWEMMHKYGVDTLRLWMYAVNQPGESKNFDEKTVSELHNKVFNLLYNVLAFYELYRDKQVENSKEKILSKNILDKWILARIEELLKNTTNQLDGYNLLEPVRAIRDFIDDLSTWYVRRSRERLKNDDVEAKATLYYVLKTLAKLMAPFAPFASEDIWQKLKNEGDVESVHLTKWPESKKEFDFFGLLKKKENVLAEMEKAREVVTLGLQKRQGESIPVRQPLNQLLITNYQLPIEYLEIIKEELNVKEIKFVEGEAKSSFTGSPDVSKETFRELKVELDTNITEDLKKEGQYRELVRAIQDIRKKNGLNPSDMITLIINADALGTELINKFKTELLKAVSAKDIQIGSNEAKSAQSGSSDASEEAFREEIKIGEFVFKVNVVK